MTVGDEKISLTGAKEDNEPVCHQVSGGSHYHTTPSYPSQAGGAREGLEARMETTTLQ